MKISAVVVTYNRINCLKKCLQCLEKQTYPLSNIIIVNNNSDDGTTEYLSTLTNDLYKIKNLSENVGGAGGFSIGTKYAFEHTDSDYFWVMDDDTYPTSSSLEELVASVKEKDGHFGFLSSNVQYSNGGGANCPEASKDWNKCIDQSLIKVDIASFVSLLYSRDTVKKVGLPVAEMFIWGDDFEYTSRINNKLGTESFFVIKSLVHHDSNNMKVTIYDCPLNMLSRYKLMYRNNIYAMKHNFPKYNFVRKMLSDTLLLFLVLCKADNNKCKRFMTVLKGILSGIFFNPKIKFPNLNNNYKDNN